MPLNYRKNVEISRRRARSGTLSIYYIQNYRKLMGTINHEHETFDRRIQGDRKILLH